MSGMPTAVPFTYVCNLPRSFDIVLDEVLEQLIAKNRLFPIVLA